MWATRGILVGWAGPSRGHHATLGRDLQRLQLPGTSGGKNPAISAASGSPEHAKIDLYKSEGAFLFPPSLFSIQSTWRKSFSGDGYLDKHFSCSVFSAVETSTLWRAEPSSV